MLPQQKNPVFLFPDSESWRNSATDVPISHVDMDCNVAPSVVAAVLKRQILRDDYAGIVLHCDPFAVEVIVEQACIVLYHVEQCHICNKQRIFRSAEY